MGSWKEKAMDEQFNKEQTRRYQKIADYLGLTLDEVESLEPEVEANETNDGAIVGWDIMFSKDTPQAILSKMGGDTHHRVDRLF